MKIRTKIYLSQLFFAMVITAFLTLTFNLYQNHYLADVDEYVDNIAKLKEKEFLSSLNYLGLIIDDKRDAFRSMNQEVLALLQNNPNLSLIDIKKRVTTKYKLKDIAIELYLVNKNLIIFDTTFEKDRGFDLSMIPNTQYYIDEAVRTKSIYFMEQLAFDSLDNYYKQYSFAQVKKDLYLEMGFIDNRLNTNIENVFKKEHTDKYKKHFFRVSDINNYQVFYKLEKQNNKFKQSFFDSLEKFYIDKNTSNPIINSIRKKEAFKIRNDNTIKVIIPILDYKKVSQLDNGFIVMEMNIDISHKLSQLNDFKFIFFLIIIFVLIFFSMGFLWIQKNFTEATDIIVKNISDSSLIKDKELLAQKTEFGVIANSYNTLVNSLKTEVASNKVLLLRNKQFIADTVHQIRSPLSVIMMNTDMIKIMQSNRTNTDEYIEQINASINMLTNSYEDLSYIISYDTIEYKASAQNLSSIVKDRIEFFSTISKVNMKPLKTHVEDHLTFNINHVEIERLIDNNISNAIKYATTQKPISIELITSEGRIRLCVSSYGKPIKNSALIFEKNYRENEEKRGLGLGLSMVKDICEKNSISYKVTYENEQNYFIYIFD